MPVDIRLLGTIEENGALASAWSKRAKGAALRVGAGNIRESQRRGISRARDAARR